MEETWGAGHGQRLVKDLIPDGLFGIEFVRDDGKFYRFHCVEIDRGTEPKTSPNKERKSLERMVLQYEDYIGNKRYQEHLGLRAPMIAIVALSQPESTELDSFKITKSSTELSYVKSEKFNTLVYA